MKIPVPNGGSSGSGSTECTATAEDILETKTAIYNGSGDEPDYGSMKNVDSIDPAKSITISSGVLYVRFTNGAHVQNASSGYPEASVPQADLASAAGLTAAKIATGNSILGVDGTYTGVGTAGTAQVLSGYTFSNASLSGASGAMSDRSGTTTSATASLDSDNSRVRMQIPNTGYYNTSAYLYTSYSSMASVIGLTADKIKKGETILGITGTWEGYVADPNDLYYQGTVGTLGGSMGLYSGDNCTISNDRSCVTMTSKAYTSTGSGNYAGISFSTPIDCKDYSKLTLTYNETVAPTQSGTSEQTNGIYIALYTSRPTTRDGFYWGNMQYYNAAQPTRNETGDGKTLTLDLSGITGTLYVGVFLSGSYAASGYEWVAEVTRISVS